MANVVIVLEDKNDDAVIDVMSSFKRAENRDIIKTNEPLDPTMKRSTEKVLNKYAVKNETDRELQQMTDMGT